MMTSLRLAADGTPCCCEFDTAGNPIPMTNPRNACDQCQAHFAAQELRAVEGRRHSAIDQAHLDAARTHAAAVLDRLHSAGARVPGVSQTAEANIEEAERAAERYEAPNSYDREISAMRAASATPEQDFEKQWKAERTLEIEQTHAALDAEELQPRMTAAELAEYAPPDPYAAGIKALQQRETR